MRASRLLGNLVRWAGLDPDQGALGFVVNVDQNHNVATVMWSDGVLAHWVDMSCLMLDCYYSGDVK
jgi:hypothetical protein